MRIGIDLGGTKIEGRAFDATGQELDRIRVATPKGDYPGTVEAIASTAEVLETRVGARGTVGVGIPGTIVRSTGLVKNANSTWLNGMPLERDLAARMGREVRCANDANCLAISEAIDGAAAGYPVVFGVIMGTGCGGGVSIHGRVHSGPNGLAGEWGHNPLPLQTPDEWPGPECYCGRRGCIEKWISGSGLERDFHAAT
ncbi:MAG: ROK family protein, partial [Terriglobus roseus]|nr:ROK family protein [Terriglobus roseus]